MESHEPGGNGGDGDDDGWLLGCVIITKMSTCLVNCSVRDPGSVGPIRVQPLCGMLTALHSLAGGGQQSSLTTSYLTLSHFSVGLCESPDGYMVGVLADPGKHRESVVVLAEIIARSFARAGGPVLHAVIRADVEHAERRMHEYTIKDELARDDATGSGTGGGEGRMGGGGGGGHGNSLEPPTMDLFSSFSDLYLRPMLLQRRPARLGWLEPCASVAGVLCTHLLAVGGGSGGGGGSGAGGAGGRGGSGSGKDGMTSSRGEESTATARSSPAAAAAVVSLPGAASAHPLAALAGVRTGGAVWDAVARHAKSLIAARARAVALAVAASHQGRAVQVRNAVDP
jgi:hypothetical protein